MCLLNVKVQMNSSLLDCTVSSTSFYYSQLYKGCPDYMTPVVELFVGGKNLNKMNLQIVTENWATVCFCLF